MRNVVARCWRFTRALRWAKSLLGTWAAPGFVAILCTNANATMINVSGHVSDHLSGQPIANATVQIQYQFSPFFVGLYTTFATLATDTSGYYQWSGDCPTPVAPMCAVHAEATGHFWAEQEFPVPAVAQVINLSLYHSANLSGHIRAAIGGSAIVNAPIMLQMYSNSSHSFVDRSNTRSDQDGSYEFSPLLPGDYRICAGSVQNGQMRQCYDHRVTPPIASGQTYTVLNLIEGEHRSNVDFDLISGGGFSGQIIDGYAHQPVRNTTYSLEIFDANGEQFSISSDTTDGSGNYSVHGLPDGSYFARIYLGAAFSGALYPNTRCDVCSVLNGTPIVVSAGQVAGGKTFTAQPYIVIHGRVTEEGTGSAIGGVHVRSSAFVGVPVVFDSTTDAKGEYALYSRNGGFIWTADTFGFVDEVHPGIPCLVDACRQIGTYVQLHVGDVAQIDFALSRGASISGAITSGGQAWLTMFVSSGAAIWAGETDKAGNYHTPGWFPGPYFLMAQQGENCQVYAQRQCPKEGAPLSSIDPTVIDTTPGANVFGVDFSFSADAIFSNGFE